MINHKKYFVKHNEKLNLSKISTSDTNGLKSKKDAESKLTKNIKELAELQAKLYAQDKYAVLIVFQAMDAAGKDGMIKHVMTGLNPQGTQVFSFKQPSKTELDHGYLWRINNSLPEKGRIGIFNRSHYEDVLVVRVHDFIKDQKIPDKFKNGKIWKQRYKQINDFERYLYENGTIILKFFLHISKEEQKKRFLKRINNPTKNWKFSEADLKERTFWNDYQNAYEEALSSTSKSNAPWYVIPSDKKWYARLVVSEIIIGKMKSLKPDFPKLDREKLKALERAKELLLNESK
ncbi:MAG: polyphosphate kinase 2 family protein [Ignavibacteriaceae bacterium]|jgi:PPK2 family polyphosphate:nucleotide phosphotransferase|nr:polyphosphate kinase 2 family protein [bacterium BMS3Abin03]